MVCISFKIVVIKIIRCFIFNQLERITSLKALAVKPAAVKEARKECTASERLVIGGARPT